MAGTATLTWEEVAATFNVLSAHDLAAMNLLERHQDIRSSIKWLAATDQPLALLFISHRWQTPHHPDPQSSDLRTIQHFVRRIAAVMAALMMDREDRLQVLPSLTTEGNLQAEEVARRMLGFGPFSDKTAAAPAPTVRTTVSEAFGACDGDPSAFEDWLLSRIGVWVDYPCMPQKPLEPDDEAEFRRSLESLDSLVTSSTVVAVRHGADDYAERGWCAAEFFLASARSFARGLFVDADRMRDGEDVALDAGSTTHCRADVAATAAKAQSFDQDMTAFRYECDRWTDASGRLFDTGPPAAWAAYRDLQGSMFYPANADPNPLRRALEAVHGIERALVSEWLMSDHERSIELSQLLTRSLEQQAIRCAEAADHIYLGLLIASHGWIEAFHPLLREGARRFVELMPTHRDAGHVPPLTVALQPIPARLRALFDQVRPSGADTWRSRISDGYARNAEEKAAIESLRRGLEAEPLIFRFADAM